MVTLAFDTLKAAKALKEAGFEEAQAEAVVATVGEAVGATVATKADVAEARTGLQAEIGALRTDMAELRADLQAEIAAVRTDLQAEIGAVRADVGALEARLFRHLWLMAVGIVGVTVTLVKLIP